MYLCMYGPRPMSMRNNNHTTVCWQSYGTWSHKEMRKGRECNDKTKKRKKKKMVCGCLLLVVPFLLCKKRKFYWFCWLLVSSASSSLHLAAGACPLSNLTSFSWECKLYSPIFSHSKYPFHSSHVHKSNIELILTYNIMLLLTLLLFTPFPRWLIISQAYRKYYKCINIPIFCVLITVLLLLLQHFFPSNILLSYCTHLMIPLSNVTIIVSTLPRNTQLKTFSPFLSYFVRFSILFLVCISDWEFFLEESRSLPEKMLIVTSMQ